MKNITLLFIFLSLCFAANAQDHNLKWGGKFGFNLANISSDPTLVDNNAGLGAEFGVFGRIGSKFYIQPGLDFVNNKMTLQRVVQPRPGERDNVILRYMRVPVLVGMETGYEGAGISRLRFMAGPSFAYAVGISDNNLDIGYRNVRKAQFALNAGLGIAVLRFIELDLMYYHGLSTVFNDNNADGKYRNFSLTLGFSI